MFEKKVSPTVNYDVAVGGDLLGFLERIEELEAESKKIDRALDVKGLEWHSNTTEITRELRFMKEELKDMRLKVHEMKKRFIFSIEEFKKKAQSEDYGKIKTLVDTWEPQKLISSTEFERLVKLSLI